MMQHEVLPDSVFELHTTPPAVESLPPTEALETQKAFNAIVDDIEASVPPELKFEMRGGDNGKPDGHGDIIAAYKK